MKRVRVGKQQGEEKNMKSCKIWETNIDGMPVSLTQNRKNSFTVRYWKQRKTKLTYSKACVELGVCVMHALTGQGLLDEGRD